MNKRNLVFIIVMVFTFHVSVAQDTGCSLLQEGKVWHYQYNPAPASLHLQHHFLVQGDTIISDVKYYKILIKMTSDTMGERPYEYYCAMREENGKVFMVNNRSEKEELLYDFNMKLGDKLRYQEGDQTVELQVKTISQIKLCNESTVKCLTLEKSIMSETTGYIYLIEGIGPSIGLTQPIGKDTGTGVGYRFLSCEDSNEQLLSEEDLYAHFYPSMIGATCSSNEPSFNIFFTLQGRRLTGKPSKGVYIQDGKKRVMK
jgi:hypothetical protein